MPSKFERDIVLDGTPLDMARRYLAVMAYPELGAGQPGGRGGEFTAALFHYAAWGYRKKFGLRASVRDISILDGEMPNWRQFEGRLNRGLARIRRRYIVLLLFNRRIIAGLGGSDQAFATIPEFSAQTPRWGEILNRDVKGWAKLAALNDTGLGDEDDWAKAKDFRRRAIAPSIPVLHLAHGMFSVLPDLERSICRWDERDPLLAMYMNPDLWIYDALAAADKFRLLATVPGLQAEISESDLIRLHWQKPAE